MCRAIEVTTPDKRVWCINVNMIKFVTKGENGRATLTLSVDGETKTLETLNEYKRIADVMQVVPLPIITVENTWNG